MIMEENKVEELIEEENITEEKKPGDKTFYTGLLIAFAAGLFVIAGLLFYLWLFLKDYEACLADNIVADISGRYEGSDIYFYEDTLRGSGVKRFRIQDGNKRLATVMLEPDGTESSFDHKKYRVLYIENEKDPSDDIMQVVETPPVSETPEQDVSEDASLSENTVSDDETEKPSLPITPEEEEAVRSLAESYVKVYAPFSTIKDIGDLRSKVLALIKEDTNLYERLKTYKNEWGLAVNGYNFGETKVSDIKKTGENEYECDVESEFITSSANYGVSRSYEMTYHMEMENVDGSLKMTSVE